MHSMCYLFSYNPWHLVCQVQVLEETHKCIKCFGCLDKVPRLAESEQLFGPCCLFGNAVCACSVKCRLLSILQFLSFTFFFKLPALYIYTSKRNVQINSKGNVSLNRTKNAACITDPGTLRQIRIVVQLGIDIFEFRPNFFIMRIQSCKKILKKSQI